MFLVMVGQKRDCYEIWREGENSRYSVAHTHHHWSANWPHCSETAAGLSVTLSSPNSSFSHFCSWASCVSSVLWWRVASFYRKSIPLRLETQTDNFSAPPCGLQLVLVGSSSFLLSLPSYPSSFPPLPALWTLSSSIRSKDNNLTETAFN